MSTTNGYIDAVRFTPEDEGLLRLRELIEQAIRNGPPSRKGVISELAELVDARTDVVRQLQGPNRHNYGKAAQPTPEGLENASPGQITEIRTTLPSGRPYVIRVHHE